MIRPGKTPGACAERGGRYKYRFMGFSYSVDLIPVGVIDRHTSMKLIVLLSAENTHSSEPKEFMVAWRDAKAFRSVSGSG
jgi:hypothetical protein